MKKTLSIIFIGMLLAISLYVPALARSINCKNYAVCTQRTCTRTANHKHKGKTYCPRAKNGGRYHHKNTGHHNRHR